MQRLACVVRRARATRRCRVPAKARRCRADRTARKRWVRLLRLVCRFVATLIARFFSRRSGSFPYCWRSVRRRPRSGFDMKSCSDAAAQSLAKKHAKTIRIIDRSNASSTGTIDDPNTSPRHLTPRRQVHRRRGDVVIAAVSSQVVREVTATAASARSDSRGAARRLPQFEHRWARRRVIDVSVTRTVRRDDLRCFSAGRM